MRWSVSWIGHGFGIGVWRTRFQHSDIWSICLLTVSVYIVIDRKQPLPAPPETNEKDTK